MLIIDDNFHYTILNAYHDYLKDPVEVTLSPDEYVERKDYISCSSLGKCPKAYAMQKLELPAKFPGLVVENDLPALMRMRGGTEAGITFAKALKHKFGNNIYAEKYLQDDILKIHGFADVILTDDIGQTAIIEVKKRAGYFNSPSEPRITDIYQLLAYGLVYKNSGINARMYLVIIDGSASYPVHVYEVAPSHGGFEVRDKFHTIIDDFTGEVIQPYTVWEHGLNAPMHLNFYAITEKVNYMHSWLSMPPEQLNADCPIPDPLNSKMGFQCIKWVGGSKPKANKIKIATGQVCASCPFSCHFQSPNEVRDVIIHPEGNAVYLSSIDT